MRPKIFFVLVSVFFTILIMGSITPRAAVQADEFLQSLPNLNGANIYFTEANGEASRFDQLDTGLSRFAGLLRLQGANLYTLEWRTRFPQDADLIIVAGPQTDFSSDQIARLWAYVTNGGHLLILVDPVVETSRNSWKDQTGLFSLMWDDMNISPRDDVVVTERSNLPQATEEAQAANSNALVADFATSHLDAKHPITASLTDPLYFFVARSIHYDASLRDYNVTPLVTSDSTFYGEMGYADYLETGTYQYNIGIDTRGADVPRGPLALAVAFENPKIGARLVVVGDRDFATNSKGFQTSPPGSASFLYPGNVRFMMNAVSWLLNAQNLELSFPTPGPTPTASTTPSPTPTFTPSPTDTPTPSVETTATPGS
jgi:ABC-type uncharacterized transport system